VSLVYVVGDVAGSVVVLIIPSAEQGA